MDEDFSLLQPLDLIQNDVNQLRQLIKDRKKNLQKDRDKDKELEKEKEHEGERERERTRVREKERLEREKEFEKSRERVEKNKEVEKSKEQEKHHKDHSDRDRVTEQEERVHVKHEENGASEGNERFL